MKKEFVYNIRRGRKKQKWIQIVNVFYGERERRGHAIAASQSERRS